MNGEDIFLERRLEQFNRQVERLLRDPDTALSDGLHASDEAALEIARTLAAADLGKLSHEREEVRRRLLANAPRPAAFFPVRVKGQVALSALMLVALLATLLLLPNTREALASFFGFRIEATENLAQPVVDVAGGNLPQPEVGLEVTDGAQSPEAGERDAASLTAETGGLPDMESGYELLIVEIPDARWLLHLQQQEAGLRLPEPGTGIALDGNRVLPVPATLPEGFAWQGVVIPDTAIVMREGLASFGSTHGGGGGVNPLPAFDRSFAAYLIGGDAADRLLLFAQFDPSSLDQLAVRTFHITAPSGTPPTTKGSAEGQQAGDVAGEIIPTPTRVPSFYEAKSQVGYIVQQGAEAQESLVVLAQDAQEITFNGITGFLYDGTWAPDGSWLEESNLTTLTWEQEGYIYQLAGQGVSADDLIQVASSIR